jgi:hypothetical protein
MPNADVAVDRQISIIEQSATVLAARPGGWCRTATRWRTTTRTWSGRTGFDQILLGLGAVNSSWLLF